MSFDPAKYIARAPEGDEGWPTRVNGRGMWRGRYGDYELRAYSQHPSDPRQLIAVHAIYNGEPVGYLDFANHGSALVANDVSVDDQHQRKGVASAMYRHAKEVSGLRIDPSDDQTSDGASLWEARQWTKLGKSQRDKDPVGIASVAVFDPEGKLLFGKRSDNGRWTNPGGHLEPGEDPATGARRELKEEAGLDLPANRFRKLGKGRAGKYLVHTYRVDLEAADMKNWEPSSKEDPDEECSEWRFVEREDGLPAEIADNLHARKNVTLRLLGLQDVADGDDAPEALDKSMRELMKRIADLPLGAPHEDDPENFDYSHLLPPQHRNDYRLTVRAPNAGSYGMFATLEHLHPQKPAQEVGTAWGLKNANGSFQPHSNLEEEHHGKGLGRAMYEALLAHGYHNGVRRVEGGQHSPQASIVHRRLKEVHGLDYQAAPVHANGKLAYSDYAYDLKGELPMNKSDEIHRLIHHPDPRERSMALKLGGVRRDHLVAALASPDPTVQRLAFDHPGANDDQVVTALMRMPDRLRLQHEALNRDGVTPQHLRELYDTASKQMSNPLARDVIQAITTHPALDEDLARELWSDPRLPSRRGLVNHPRFPGDLLGGIVRQALDGPEMALAGPLARDAARHPALPLADREEAVKRAQGPLRVAVASSPVLEHHLITDILAGGKIPKAIDPDVDARVAALKGQNVTGAHLDMALEDHHPAVRAAVFDSPSPDLGQRHVKRAFERGEPELVQIALGRQATMPKSGAHPHSYPWHDGHTSHHQDDLVKADPTTPHPHTWDQKQATAELAPPVKTGQAGGVTGQNDQAAGIGVSTYAQFAGPYGKVHGPGSPTNLKHYDYSGKGADVDRLVAQHGFQTYYAGGKYGKPDLANKNYNTKHLMIYDPDPGSGGDFGEREYTDAWRKTHELAHALTYPELNDTYNEGRRIGKLGYHRTTREALRAVHWEWLAAHKQRELSEQIGVHIPDEAFHRELNTVMHDAVHRAVTGKFTEPSGEGFEPSSEKVPLEHALGMVKDNAHRLGLKGMEDLIQRTRKSETGLTKNTDPSQFKALVRASDPKGRDLVDHRGQLDAHPAMHQRFVDNYRKLVLDSPDVVKRLANKKDEHGEKSLQGISGKVIFGGHLPDEPDGVRYMVKPYHERITRRCLKWMKHPHQGWAEMTTQALFHAAGIGHLHQAVHVAEHNMGLGFENEPALVIRMAPGYQPVTRMATWSEPEDEDYCSECDGSGKFKNTDEDCYKCNGKGLIKVPGKGDGAWKLPGLTDETRDQARKIGFMDFLANNLDRHGHNLLYHPETHQLLSIDTPRSYQYIVSAEHLDRRGRKLCPHCGGPILAAADDKPLEVCPNRACRRPTTWRGVVSEDDSMGPYILDSALRDADFNRDDVRSYDTRRRMQEAYKPVTDWWWEHRNKVRMALRRQLQHVRDPQVREHIAGNFEARANHLDQMADIGIDNYGDKWYETQVPMYRPGERHPYGRLV